ILLATGKDIYIPDGSITQSEINTAMTLLDSTTNNARYTYVDYLRENQLQVDYGVNSIIAELDNVEAGTDPSNGHLSLDMPKNTTAIYTVIVPEDGFYHIGAHYKVANATLNQITIDLKINDQTYYEEMKTIELPIIWQDQTKDYAKDRYGDEVLPNQVIVDTWHFTPLYNNTYVSVDPLLYKFNAGLNTIKITNTSSSLFRISNTEVFQPTKLDSYDEYKSNQ